MSIFVDPDALIPIRVRYLELKNDDGKVIGVKILSDDTPKEELQREIICTARGRDYKNMSEILEQCTLINHITGKPMIRSKVFRTMIMERFFVTWNVFDANQNMIEINNNTINNMHEQLVKKLVNKWVIKTTG
jgi:hypothetical protein